VTPECAGHVEANLEPDSLQKVLDMMEFVQIGGLPPHSIDGDYGEYTYDNFTFMMKIKEATPAFS